MFRAGSRDRDLEQLRREFPRELISTSRKWTIVRPLPDPLILSNATEGDAWVHLASLEQLKLGLAFAVAEKFNRASKRGALIEFGALRHADDAEYYSLKAQGLAPRAGTVKELIVCYGATIPQSLLETLSFERDSFPFSPVHDGLWARLEPTPRALTFIARRMLTSVESHFATHSELGTLITGVSFG